MTIPFNPYFTYDSLLQRNPLRTTRNRLLTRTVAPASEPVTLSEAKLYLRIDNTNEDSLISDLIVAARMISENWLKRSLITQTWEVAFDLGIPQSIWLPMGPVTSLVSLVVKNQDGTTTIADPSSYWLNAAQNALVMNTLLTGFQIQVTYNTGYGDATSIPKPIKQGLLGHIAAMYDSRGESGSDVLPEQVAGLYSAYRELRL